MSIQNAINLIDTGIIAADGNGEYFGRTIIAGNGIVVAHGNGVSGNPTIAALEGIGVVNLGISYSSNTLTVLSAGGTALSGSNIGYVTLQSKGTSGQLVTIPVTANQSIVDSGGSSEMVDNLFGLPTGDNWGANDLPFFLYAVSNDDEDAIAFMFSRVPQATVSPASGSIGKPSSADADTQGSFLSLEDVTVGDYDENPCICIGSFRMRFTQPGAADDWTVQTLAARDGIGNYQEGYEFVFPAGTMGNASGSFFSANGGTAPLFDSESARYKLSRTGFYQLRSRSADCSTSGVGAVELRMYTPFTAVSTIYGNSTMTHVTDAAPPAKMNLAATTIVGGYLSFHKGDNATAAMLNTAIVNSNDGDTLGITCSTFISLT